MRIPAPFTAVTLTSLLFAAVAAGCGGGGETSPPPTGSDSTSSAASTGTGGRGQGGEGVLFVQGRPAGYCKIGAASFGLQAGGQSFSYALFLMNDEALNYLRKSNGWSIGSGPSVVVVDKGAAMSTTSTTLAKDVYAFPFGQKGLMAGLGLEGSKITPIRK